MVAVMKKSNVILFNIFFYLVVLLLFNSCINKSENLFSVNEYKAHFGFLSNDLCEGRKPGTKGGNIAALYIAKQFQSYGLKPVSEETGYFQNVPMVGFSVDYNSVKCSISSDNEQVSIKPFEEIILLSQDTINNIDVQGEMVFVGYGIDAPEYNWEDFKGEDLSDKILVFLCDDPDFEKTGFGSESWTYYSLWTYKEEMAIIQHAKGIIYLHKTDMADFPFSVVQHSLTPEWSYSQERLKNPLKFYAWMSFPAFEKVFNMANITFEQLKNKADSKEFKPTPLNLNIDVSFNQKFRLYDSPNVIGILPGTKYKDECIIYMAHYDHLGIGTPVDGDSIYNGAQDNASGSAALISLAKAYSIHPTQKNILFLATTGEESTMLGSDYYARHPVFPLDKTDFGINMDMLDFYGKRSGFVLNPIQISDAKNKIQEIADDMNLELLPDYEGSEAFRSDNFSLYSRGVVTPSIFLDGEYLTMSKKEVEETYKEIGDFYHLPNDEIYQSFRYDGVLQYLEIAYRVGRYFAESDEKPVMFQENPFSAATKFYQLKKEKGIY